MLYSAPVALTFVSMQITTVIAIERNYFQAEKTLGDFSFRYYDTPKTFEEAQKNCTCKDGWLAEPRYQDIQDIVSSFTNESVWIGLSWGTGKWQWDNGDDMQFENWKTRTNSSLMKCASISAKSEWTESQCDASLPFVCQHDTTFIGNQELDIRNLESQKVSHNTASENCKNINWTGLVDVKSKALNDHIENENTGVQFFTGAKQSDTGEWTWSDDCPIEFTDWKNNEPNKLEEKCLAATKTGWIDVNCGSTGTRNYICRKEIPGGDCSSELCSSKGNCTRVGKRYSCECIHGYYGSKCEKELSNDTCAAKSCSSKGYCVRLGEQRSCKCILGYHGAKCENELEEVGKHECVESQISILWEVVNHQYRFDYRLKIKNLEANDRKMTSVEIRITGSKSPVEITDVNQGSRFCKVKYTITVSTHLSIEVEVITARMNNAKLPVLSKILYKYPETMYRYIILDAA